jgi:transcription antitermination protein NusB
MSDSPDEAGRVAQAGRKRGKSAETGQGSAKARRSAARLAAVQALYQTDLAGTPVDRVISEFVQHRIGKEQDGENFVPADAQMFTEIVRGSTARKQDVDGILSGALDLGHSFERLEHLLRAILRAGCFELLAHQHIHPRIIISDYINIAHAFYAGREPGLVNGVLDRIGRDLRPGELAVGESGGGSEAG